MTPEVAERPRCRRFTLADLMILVVALAAGLAVTRRGFIFAMQSWGRITWPKTRSASVWWDFLFGKFGFVYDFVHYFNMLGNLLLGCLLLGFLVMRLRRPRPPLRHIVRQPGFAGCGLTAVLYGLLAVSAPWIPASWWLTGFGTVATYATILAAPLAWAWLFVSRRWLSEAGWLDRLGRVLAALWVVSSIGTHVGWWWLS